MRPDEVHVWAVDLSACAASAGESLDRAERARAARILSPLRRERWRAARGVLRVLLGRYLELAPASVPLLQPSAAEPPVLAGPGPAFALSHSGELALYALAATGPLGVDLELAHGRAPRPSVAARAFGPGFARELERLPAAGREAAFLRRWVRHEAALKYRRTGVFAAAAPARLPVLLELGHGGGWVGALALEHAPGRVRFWTLAGAQPPRSRGSARPIARSSEPRPRPSRESCPITP